ncbi:MAG: hypothetical protein AAF289_05065 [Cyanobacteria bacterium P01_A01_bin.135]
MYWITLIFLGLTIATCQLIQACVSEHGRYLGILVATVFLSVGLVNAPILLKGVVLLWLLIEPKLFRHRPS